MTIKSRNAKPKPHSPRSARDIDVHLGKRLRTVRLLRRMSQIELAHALRITFQQVQKYESGVNRISAGRLFDIARTFGVSLDYFFEGFSPRSLAKKRRAQIQATADST
jgi:transcriptional regulator with XRE-family HTH domain